MKPGPAIPPSKNVCGSSSWPIPDRCLPFGQSKRKRKADWAEIQELVGISRATYYRQAKELRQKGLRGLKPKSKRPKRFRRKVLWTPELLIRVEALRKANPTWGRWPIWLTLCKEGFNLARGGAFVLRCS